MVVKKIPRRGGYRTSFYGNRGPHNSGPNFQSGCNFEPIGAGVGQPSIPTPGRPAVFDFTLSRDSFEGTTNTTDAVFEREIIDRAASLTPTNDVKTKVNEFTVKVINSLEKIKTENCVVDTKIENIAKVGSFVTDTALSSTNKSDVVVQLSTLPSFETVSALGDKIAQLIKDSYPKDCPTSVAHDYGCCIMTPSAQVRILVTINPENANKLEPELHLSERTMMINFFALRQTSWFASVVETNDADFVQEFKSLVRVLKDVRIRYPLFMSLSPWVIQYFAYYCLMNGPNRQKANLGTAFRRFFELLASGIMMPKSNSLVDPTTFTHRIGFDLTHQQMDEVCRAAQTLVQVFAAGNDGYRAVLGVGQQGKDDVTQKNSKWDKITIHPSTAVYIEGCMDPYLPEMTV